MLKKYFLVILIFLSQPVIADTDKYAMIWEIQNPDFSPEARRLLKTRCELEAKEEIYTTAEDVRSILRIDSVSHGHVFVGGLNKSYGSHGISYTNKLWMFFRLGLDFVEYELSDTEELRKNAVYGKFDLHSRREVPIGELNSQYAIRFSENLMADFERLGLRGRTIEVLDMASGETLGKRTEFFWLNPNPRRGGVFVCPLLQTGQSTPLSFLSRVINPKTYGCYYKNEKYYGFTNHDRRIKSIEACELEFWQIR
jgi:hypothetical protein